MPFISSVRGTYGGLGKTGITAPYSLISYAGTVYNMASSTITFSTPGEYSIVLPYAGRVRARVWGAGGGGSQPGGWGGQSVGGSGGFSTGVVSLPAGTSKVIVGEGGNGNTARFVFGGGRSSQPNGGESDNRYSACGGGFSGILSGSGVVHDSTPSVNNNYRTAELQARSIIIAGGGGGGGNHSGGTQGQQGGHGGGSSGTGGYVVNSLQTATAGTQTSAGSNSFGDQWGGRIAAAFMGGSSGSGQGYGAGGGGGYFGGSSGENSSHMSGAGGGSGFIHPTLVTSGSTSAGSGQTSPGGNGTTGYIGGVGYGGNTGSSSSSSSWNGGSGGGGLVILTVV